MFENNSKNPALWIAYAAMTAGIYTALTLVFAPISFGPVQFRISEVLCVLPIFFPAAVPGLFIGCFIANFLAGAVAADIVFGSLATLIGAAGTYMLREKKYIASLPPVIANILIIPFVLKYAYGMNDFIPFMMLTVGAGEFIAVCVLGNMLSFTLSKYKKFIFTAEHSNSKKL